MQGWDGCEGGGCCVALRGALTASSSSLPGNVSNHPCWDGDGDTGCISERGVYPGWGYCLPPWLHTRAHSPSLAHHGAETPQIWGFCILLSPLALIHSKGCTGVGGSDSAAPCHEQHPWHGGVIPGHPSLGTAGFSTPPPPAQGVALGGGGTKAGPGQARRRQRVLLAAGAPGGDRGALMLGLGIAPGTEGCWQAELAGGPASPDPSPLPSSPPGLSLFSHPQHHIGGSFHSGKRHKWGGLGPSPPICSGSS